MDIKSAFRLLPVHPSDFQLLGLRIMGNFFFDKCLPMGCSISCALFETFSTFVEWKVRSLSGRKEVDHYLDDFLLGGRPEKEDCTILMTTFIDVCSDLGVPIAHENTVGPTKHLTYLGLDIDTVEMCIRIPAEKISELTTQLEKMLCKNKTTLKSLQSLVGVLNFCSRAIPAGRAFSRRFYGAMSGVQQPYHFIRVTHSMKEDIRVWLSFLELFNGCCYFPDLKWATLHLFTDSSGGKQLGCGSYYEPHWAYFSWPVAWKEADILRDMTFLELVPIVLAFHIWSHHWVNRKIVLHIDNQALVTLLNKKTCRSSRVMNLVRPLVFQCLLYNIQFKAVHIAGIKNEIADSISRQQWSRFRRLAPQADHTAIPYSGILSNADLETEACRLLSASIAPKTHDTYLAGKNAFDRFRSEFHKTLDWPPTVQQIAEFIAYLSAIKLAPNTAKAYVSAISFQCKLMGAKDVTKHFINPKIDTRYD